ncbi:hypothetical protein MTO96_026865 [Rhipicephalus appendiculatus]
MASALCGYWRNRLSAPPNGADISYFRGCPRVPSDTLVVYETMPHGGPYDDATGNSREVARRGADGDDVPKCRCSWLSFRVSPHRAVVSRYRKRDDKRYDPKPRRSCSPDGAGD